MIVSFTESIFPFNGFNYYYVQVEVVQNNVCS